MALNLYSGNQLEHLAEIFCEKIYRKPCGNIFEPEQVVVQTGGMELFLRKYLAKNAGISANLETPFLNRFVNNVMRALLPQEKYKAFSFSSEQYSPDILKWHIFDELMNHSDKYPAALLKYASTPEYCYQLSAQLARIFDRYIWYHYKKLFQWRQNPDEENPHWEKTLYLALTEKIGPSQDCFLADIHTLAAPAEPQFLASRYSLFGVGSIPPILLDFCKKTAEFTDIYLFYLNPSQAYWGDMKSDFQRRREARENQMSEPELQIHNPLLANSGTWGRDFFENTLDVMSGSPGEESFTEPEQPEKKLLHRIQLDILNSVNSTPADGEEPQSNPYADDHSIAIHNCHNCRREVEVLHDQLLLALDELDIRPDDIIVMAPDINVYAPYIETIFSSGKLDHSFGISDRSLTAISSTAENFLKLLNLNSSRCTAAELYDILHAPAIRENFAFDDSEMESIQNFITSSNICWGENAIFRKEFGISEFEDFSWQEGFDRLLLGYAAVESENDKLATDLAPACNVFGTEAELLGKFIAVINKIFEWRNFSCKAHTASQWIACLEEMIDYLYGHAYSRKKETGFIRSSLNNWLKNIRKAGFEQPFSIKILKKELSSLLNGTNDTQGYLTQGITFCSLVPMRSIPAKVIAVLGLKAQDFPRQDVNSTLNIFPAVRGERSRLLEDRYLFLETIMAARERLLLFYPGQGTDEKSNTSPSIPLADLSKYLSDCFGFKETKQFRHGYASEYFSSAHPESFSYSRHFYDIAEKFRKPTEDPEPAVWNSGTTVKAPDGSVRQLTEYSISSLAWLLSNPLSTFIKHTFGISQYKPKEFAAPEQEPLDCKLSVSSLQKVFTGKENISDLSRSLERTRQLPPGAPGQFHFEQAVSSWDKKSFDNFKGKMSGSEKILLETILDSRYRLYDLHWQVKATRELLFLSDYDNDRAYLEFYLAHLVNTIQTNGTAAEPAQAILKTSLIKLSVLSLDDAKTRLTALFKIAEEAQNRPLPVFPVISKSFAQNGNLDKAIEGFEKDCLAGDDNAQQLQKFFGKTPFADKDFSDEFQQLACLIYQPWYKPVQAAAQEENNNE